MSTKWADLYRIEAQGCSGRAPSFIPALPPLVLLSLTCAEDRRGKRSVNIERTDR